MIKISILFYTVFALDKQESVRGTQTSVILYNPDSVSELDYVLVRKSNDKLIIVGMTTPYVDKVVCRQTITTQIIVGRRGCDNKDESKSVMRTNCGHKTVDGLLDYWFFSPFSDLCLLAPTGSTCIGPPWLFSTGLPFDARVNTDWDLLQGVYVTGLHGFRCALPSITRVDVQMPTLTVQSNCSFLPEGEYRLDESQNQIVVKVFWRLTTSLEITLNSTLSQLEIKFVGNLVYRSEGDFSFGVLFHPSSCYYRIDMVSPPKPLVLNPIQTPYYANYPKKKFYFYNRDAVCNFGVGKKSDDGTRPLYWGLPEGVPYGGKILFRTADGLPLQVTADSMYDSYVADCARFYPKSETFHGFGIGGSDGPLYNRLGVYTCYAPFPYPEKIVEVGTQEEREKQCFMLGGFLATDTGDVCSMDSWRTYCRAGWLYFDNRCWYKFDPEIESNYKTGIGTDSDTVCLSLHPHAISAHAISFPTKAWIQRFFVYYKYTGTITRIVQEGNRCLCFSGLGTESCDCNGLAFPMCSYHIKNDLPSWWDIDIHPDTLYVLKHGQVGKPMGPEKLQCECELGWKGEFCQFPTCVLDVHLALTLNDTVTNPLVTFYQKCYRKKRGFCDMATTGSVYRCACAFGYGPWGDLQANLYVDTPCMCPSLSVPSSTGELMIAIDYNVSYTIHGVCGFLTRGMCQTEGYNDARCICNTRATVMEGTREIAFNGKACACRVAHYFNNNPLSESICNRHGTCCPHGERDDKGRGYCPPQYDGCFCDDGWGGEACTSSVPKRRTLEHPFLLDSTDTVYAKQKNRGPIGFVYVNYVSATLVYLKDQTDGSILYNCTWILPEEWEYMNSSMGSKWDCNDQTAWYVFVDGEDNQLYTPALSISETRFSICGLHPNLVSARFFDIPLFRGVEETQPFRFARYGSTNTVCFCQPGYVGSSCDIPISGWRLEESSAVYTPVHCGDSTEPKRGHLKEHGCECHTIGEGILFTGESCECPIVDGLPCAGKGTCVPPRFPNGSCSFDIQDLHLDSLSVPFNTQDLRYYLYLVQGSSYFISGGFNYTLDTGDYVQIKGEYSAHTIQSCLDDSPGYFIYIYEVFQVEAWCLHVLRVDATPPAFIANCSSPIYRLFNDNLVSKGEFDACPNEPITRFHNTLGAGYGLFHNYTPGVDFTKKEWTLDGHYKLINSVYSFPSFTSFTDYVNQWDLDDMEIISVNFTSNIGIRHGLILSPGKAWHRGEIIAGEHYILPWFGYDFNAMVEEETDLTNTTLYLYRNTSKVIESDILYNHVMPHTTLNSSSLFDLESFYRVYLSPRVCSGDAECSQFHPDSYCVPDQKSVPFKIWRGGDVLVDGGIGDEGGCECEKDGFYSPQSFCARCQYGYGPDTPEDFAAMYDYNTLLNGTYNETWFLETDINMVKRCTLPIKPTSTRASAICGGKGYVEFNETVVTMEKYHLENEIMRRCNILNGEYTLIEEDFLFIGLSSYINSNHSHIVNEIHGILYDQETGEVVKYLFCDDAIYDDNHTNRDIYYIQKK